jgi:hypothetical protein
LDCATAEPPLPVADDCESPPLIAEAPALAWPVAPEVDAEAPARESVPAAAAFELAIPRSVMELAVALPP